MNREYVYCQSNDTPTGAAIQQMHEKIIHHLDRLLNAYTNTFPASAVKAFNSGTRVTYATHIKAWVGVVHLLMLRISNSRRYVFETFRYKEIIDCLKPKEILILGGRKDLHTCLKNGYGFFWTAGIDAAIILAWRGRNMAPLKLQIKLARKQFKRNKKYFFLYEDTLPVGLFFALLGNSCSHPTVCIQHGFYVTEPFLLDGLLCRYHLLYALEQKILMHPSNSTFFELGPPFNVVYATQISNEIVLVGTGENGLWPDFYVRSLDVYSRIQEQLSERGWNVIYRPHPSEAKSDYSPYFPETDKRSKVACLSGTKKIFVGYVSTLLYEAKISGHSVLCLIDPAMPKIAFIPNGIIDANSLANIEDVVRDLHSEMENTSVHKLPPLRDRFLSILKGIELENE